MYISAKFDDRFNFLLVLDLLVALAAEPVGEKKKAELINIYY